MMSFLKKVLKGSLKPFRDLRRRRIRRGLVAYYPCFASQDELNNHYHRAAWYLPYVAGRLHEVVLFQTYTTGEADPGPRPAYMCPDTPDLSHIKIVADGWWSALKMALCAQVILVWKGYAFSPPVLLARILGATVLNIATEDPKTREYGIYCKLIWAYLTSREERDRILDEHARRFSEVADAFGAKNYARACVMGSGPSLEEMFKFDFSDTLTLMCNTTIADDRIMNHVRPTFVSACDVVSHLGVSAQSYDFRLKLVEAFDKHEFFFVTTASFGYLFTLNYPKYKDRVILIEQTRTEPVYDLFADFALPQLDSVMNILMLPLAATFVDEIWLLGCDGKSNVRSNEDFWAHAAITGADHGLVESGHLCHPMFDVHRQQITYDRYNESMEQSVGNGERRHGIVCRTLLPSNTPALSTRGIPQEWHAEYDKEHPCPLSVLSGHLGENRPAREETETSTPSSEQQLPTKLAVSECSVSEDRLLHIRGWVLSTRPVSRIVVSINGKSVIIGERQRLHRPDVIRGHPGYPTQRPGFDIQVPLDSFPRANSDVTVSVFSRFDCLTSSDYSLS